MVIPPAPDDDIITGAGIGPHELYNLVPQRKKRRKRVAVAPVVEIDEVLPLAPPLVIEPDAELMAIGQEMALVREEMTAYQKMLEDEEEAMILLL